MWSRKASPQGMSTAPSRSLWRPTNALAALGILILKACARLSIPAQHWLGSALGSLVWYILPYRKHVGMANLRICFPEMPEPERKQLLKRHYQSMGIGIFEMASAWYKDWEDLASICEVEGLENIKAVESSGRGAIVFTGHFTTLELIGRFFLHYHQLSCHYRHLNQPVLNHELESIRAEGMQELIGITEVKKFIRCLREGQFVWYTPDQGRRIKYSVILPFFGEPAVTNTTTGRIARAGNAAVIPFTGYRRPDGRYKIEIFPEDPDMLDEDPLVEGAALNRHIEAFVRKAPEQYFWLHKRYKYRGDEFPDVYAK